MKPRYVYTALICALLIFLAAIITMRLETEPIEPPAIHTEAPADVAADAEPTTLYCTGGGFKGWN